VTTSKISKTELLPDFGIYQRKTTNGIQAMHSKNKQNPGKYRSLWNHDKMIPSVLRNSYTYVVCIYIYIYIGLLSTTSKISKLHQMLLLPNQFRIL
jgi:hypothetical protein